MAGKRLIDLKRDAAITLQIGGEDKSAAGDFLSTGDVLYVIKETGVFRIQLADDIDPGRTNPNIPNLNQQILAEGNNNEVVARTLLTAKNLFDERNATVTPFVANLFKKCIVLTGQLLELDAMTRELADEIRRKEAAFAAIRTALNAFSLPSVPGMDTRLHSILSNADKAKDTVLATVCLQFLPDAGGKVKLKDVDRVVETSLQTQPQLVVAWKQIAKYCGLVRNMRNVCEHPKENYRVVLTDFSMQPDGQINPPLVEIQHPDTPIRTLPLVEFLEFIRDTMLEHAETTFALIKLATLLKHNPFGEWVTEFSKEERRHKFVRYYRVINRDGRWRILG
jgi:hypothetical protein